LRATRDGDRPDRIAVDLEPLAVEPREAERGGEGVPALGGEGGPRLGGALEIETRIAPVVRRDPLARDDMKISFAVGIAQPAGHRLDPDGHGPLAGHGLQALRSAR